MLQTFKKRNAYSYFRVYVLICILKPENAFLFYTRRCSGNRLAGDHFMHIIKYIIIIINDGRVSRTRIRLATSRIDNKISATAYKTGIKRF